MRPPVDSIYAPPFPGKLPWINVAMLRLDQQLGRPVLIEFWDFCRVSSIRTLPYLKAWNERYEGAGLRVVGIHASGFPPSRGAEAVEAAVHRLEVPYPVVVDADFEIWQLYGNLGWPARYLFDQEHRLFEFHYGEGGYAETELAIQELLGISQPVLAPLRPEDAPDAELVAQSDDVEGAYSGPYEAGGVWGVLDGTGHVQVDGRRAPVDHPGCYELVRHPVSTRAELRLELDDTVRCYATCFTPGLAPAGGRAGSPAAAPAPPPASP